MTLAFLVGAAFAATPIVFLLTRRVHPGWTALLPGLLFWCFVTQADDVLHTGEILESVEWIPSLGVTLSMRLDALSLAFCLLITGIGAGIFLYASAYLERNDGTPRFFATLTAFMAAMLGAVLADDLIGLILFWELTSLTSFLLIGYDPSGATARRSAQQGLLITVAGGLCLLTGAILLGAAAGTYRISGILAHGGGLFQTASGAAIMLLIALGAFSKSAQSPLHSWLPNAMAAPTPVSAYLHSATMVKLGVYLLARLNPVLSDAALWTPLLTGIGMLTMLTGTLLALRETDLKRVLAYSTVVSLGTLVTLIGIGHPQAAAAMAVFLVVHALYKACLFMVAGMIDHATGTRDLSVLGGLGRAMPLTAAVACLAAASMAGLPPLLGFIGKELMYEAGLAAGLPAAAMAAMVLANACMVLIAALIALRCFFAPGRDEPHTPHAPHDPPWPMLAGPAALALLGLGLGLWPAPLQTLAAQIASAVHGEPVTVSLALWHGWTPLLALSGLTLLLGLAGWRCWPALRRRTAGISAIDRWGPDALYDKALDGLARLAGWQTRMIQTGSLRHYTAMSLTLVSGAVLLSLSWHDGLALPAVSLRDAGVELALPVLLILASLAVLRADSFVQGIVAAGTVGFGAAVVFLLGGAPDLAFTQFSVEALAIVILLAIIGRMPFRDSDPRRTPQRVRDAAVATAFGAMFAAVMLAVVALPFDESLSDFFRQASYPEAHGRNLVNVIIVDFRALDTLGEITVLALAALAAAALFIGASSRGTPGPAVPRAKDLP